LKLCKTDMSTQQIGCEKGDHVSIYDVKAIFVSSVDSTSDCEQTKSYSRRANVSEWNTICKYDSIKSVCELTYDSYKNLFISNTTLRDTYNKVPIRYDISYNCGMKLIYLILIIYYLIYFKIFSSQE